MRCSFIADLHLDPTTPVRNDAFRTMLRRESARCDELYVLGDLTEAWIGDDDDCAFAELVRNELKNAGTQCRVHLMHGNRDFLIGYQFARTCGVSLIEDPCVIERNGKRIVLCHGDTLCTDDLAYQQMRSLVRAPSWREDTLARSLADRRTLAALMRFQSRASNANKSAEIMDVAEVAVAQSLQLHRADVMIHGHTHRPGIHQIAAADRHQTRYVLGDWEHCGWLLRFDGEFNMFRFPLEGHCET